MNKPRRTKRVKMQKKQEEKRSNGGWEIEECEDRIRS